MIVRFILTLAIIYLAYRLGKYIVQLSDKNRQRVSRSHGEIASEDLIKDPQCGTYVPQSSAVKSTIGGEDFYFCSETCRDRYREAYKNKH